MKYLSLFKPLIIFSCVTNILMLVSPLHMMQVYDRVLSSGSVETLLYLTLIAFVLLALFGFSEALRGRLAHRISAQFAAQNADFLFDALSRNLNGKSKSIDLMRKLTQVQTFLASRAFIGLFDFPFAPFFLILLFLVHWQIGLLTVGGAGILVTIAYLNKSNTTELQSKSTEMKSKSIHFAQAVFERSEDIKAMGLIPALGERWGRMYSKSLNAQDMAAASNSFYYGISRSVRMILQISIMAWGAFLVLSGDMSGGLIFAASIISGKVLQPIEQVIGGWDNISRARKDYQELIDFAVNLPEQIQQIRQPDPQGNLKAHNISFAIENNGESHALLHQVSLEVEPGEICAIVGPSGAGKSTFARILAGAVQPSDGDLTLDGCHHANWPSEQWGQCVGYVAQDILLFPASLAENIARMDVRPDEQRVLAAAQAAGVHDLINSFPDGYQTILGPGGIRLSGGQKQRIALARALYSDPKVLVLDEPNAHLDSAGERSLMASLSRLRDKGTCIVLVSQRRSLMQLANKIMIIEAGKCTSIKRAITAAQDMNPAIKKHNEENGSVPIVEQGSPETSYAGRLTGAAGNRPARQTHLHSAGELA